MIEDAFQENVNLQIARLTNFSALLERMFERSIGRQDGSTHLTLLFASILKIRQSARAVRLLSEAGCVEEILSISRTLLEVTVNAGYLQAANSREVERYFQFHPETPNRYAMARPSPPRAPGLQLFRRIGQLSLFRGSPTRRQEPAGTWTALTLMERAAVSDQASEIPVMVLLVQRCFTRGLAAVQGTIGSLDVFVSAISSMETPRLESRLAELTEALFGINLCLLTLCMYLNSFFQLQMDGEIDSAAHDEAGDRSWA